MHVLRSVLYTFPIALMGRICLTVKNVCSVWLSFLVLLYGEFKCLSPLELKGFNHQLGSILALIVSTTKFSNLIGCHVLHSVVLPLLIKPKRYHSNTDSLIRDKVTLTAIKMSWVVSCVIGLITTNTVWWNFLISSHISLSDTCKGK